MSTFPLSSEEKEQYTILRDINNSVKEGITKSYKNAFIELDRLETNIRTTLGLYENIQEENLSGANEAGKKFITDCITRTTGQFRREIQFIRKSYFGILKDLTNILDESKLSIPGAEKECSPCDMKSVFYVGKATNGFTDEHYECALCGRNNLSEHYRYDAKK